MPEQPAVESLVQDSPCAGCKDLRMCSKSPIFYRPVCYNRGRGETHLGVACERTEVMSRSFCNRCNTIHATPSLQEKQTRERNREHP